jgi:hypothetical protein
MQVEVAETGLSHTGLYLLNRNAFVGLDFIPYQMKYIYETEGIKTAVDEVTDIHNQSKA